MSTFTLLALLLYPDGEYRAFDLGATHSYEECQLAKERAAVQLSDDLSVAQLIALKCKEEIGI